MIGLTAPHHPHPHHPQPSHSDPPPAPIVVIIFDLHDIPGGLVKLRTGIIVHAVISIVFSLVAAFFPLSVHTSRLCLSAFVVPLLIGLILVLRTTPKQHVVPVAAKDGA